MDEYIWFIHSSIDGHLGCFYLLAIVNNAAMNMGMKISFQDPAFSSFGYLSRSGTAGSHRVSGGRLILVTLISVQ